MTAVIGIHRADKQTAGLQMLQNVGEHRVQIALLNVLHHLKRSHQISLERFTVAQHIKRLGYVGGE